MYGFRSCGVSTKVNFSVVSSLVVYFSLSCLFLDSHLSLRICASEVSDVRCDKETRRDHGGVEGQRRKARVMGRMRGRHGV
jgi:hypothetical protein